MKVGKYEVSAHNLGFFRLDGGSMFGSVPKNLWSRLLAADEDNCIKLATRCLLIRGAQQTILVDVGLGEKWNDKLRAIFAIDNMPRAEWGFDTEDITDIVLTHLHFDHAGGITRYRGKGSEVELCFPQARVWLQRSNYNNACDPNPREKASYLKENVEPLLDGSLELLDGDSEIFPGIWVHSCEGHTVGQQWLEVCSDNESIMFPTDLIPTSHHLPLPYCMGYDICPATIMQEKDRLLQRALEQDSIIVFEHDPDIAAARIGKNDRGHYCIREQVKV